MKASLKKAKDKTCNNFKNLTFSIARRVNLKQTHSIISHCYNLNVHKIKSSIVVSKNELQYANIIPDFPDYISKIHYLSINDTSFKTGLAVKYKLNGVNNFGIFESAFVQQDKFVCIIKKLHALEFDVNANSLKVEYVDEWFCLLEKHIISGSTTRIIQLLLKYISFKYIDD